MCGALLSWAWWIWGAWWDIFVEIPSQQCKQAQKSFWLNLEFISITDNWIQVVQSPFRGRVQTEKLGSGMEYPEALAFMGRTERGESTRTEMEAGNQRVRRPWSQEKVAFQEGGNGRWCQRWRVDWMWEWDRGRLWEQVFEVVAWQKPDFAWWETGDERVGTEHLIEASRWFPVNKKAGNWSMKHDIGFREERVRFVCVWKRLQLCLVLVGKNKESFT